MPTHSRFHMSPRKLEAIRLKIGGKSYRQIGDELGVTAQRAAQLVAAPPTVNQQVRARRKCADCKVGIPVMGEDGYGEVHGHVHHNRITATAEEYSLIGNLVLLCTSCHAKRHTTHQQ